MSKSSDFMYKKMKKIIQDKEISFDKKIQNLRETFTYTLGKDFAKRSKDDVFTYYLTTYIPNKEEDLYVLAEKSC